MAPTANGQGQMGHWEGTLPWEEGEALETALALSWSAQGQTGWGMVQQEVCLPMARGGMI